MNNRGYAYAIRAMGTLEMYSEMYAGDSHYQHELNHLLNTLRMRAETMGSTAQDHGHKKFLMAFADALEVANQPGEYVPLSQR